jgi:predicted AAA+ superfamily ATPase
VLVALKKEEKNRFLCLKREDKTLQNKVGTCKERRWEISVEMLTELNAPRMSTKMAKKNSLLLKE